MATEDDGLLFPGFVHNNEPWRDEWKGMPEFIQEDLSPWKQIIVSFACRADMETFAKLVGQRINFETRNLWYPEAEIGHFANKRYTDEP